MEQENHRSSVGGMEGENLKPAEGDGGGSKEEAKFDENDAERRVSEADCSDCTAEKTISGERGESRSETLTSVRVSGNEFESYSPESSNTLMEVPVVYSLHPLQSAKNWKDEIRVLNKEPDKDIAGQPAGIEIQTQVQLQTVESGNSDCCMVQDKPNSLDPKPLSTVPMLKAPDGYNWRKYGQKQVKSPEGFRSYYRCTNSDCLAKKIECCNRSNHAIETVYRSHHNHDPPQKANCARENKPSLAVAPVNGTHEITHSGRGLNDSVPSTPKESIVPIDRIQETKQQDSCGSDETTEINIKEEYVDGPEYKRRQKRSSSSELDSHNKSGKKPKYVVHAPGDDCISSDGYRWRKYGQKMVKGNPHPRNYYRCTSAGCPARKHIERAVDNAGAVVITYNGVHDHDMPVPRKRHGARNLSAAASVTADNLPISKTEPHQSHSHQSVDKESDSLSETLNPGGEKSSESARTLLSIGFEIKPC